MHRRYFIQRIVNAGALTSFLAAFIRGTANGVMVRHDVPEKDYLALGARNEFETGRVTILDNRGNYTGVLISNRHILTVGHPIIGYLPQSESKGQTVVKIQFQGEQYETEYAYLHPRYDRVAHHGGSDLAILRLKAPGISKFRPARIWTGGLSLGDRFVGVGQGKSGTGKDNNEPKPAGIFRGYENTIDYLFSDTEFSEFRSDFDDGTEQFNTLARVLFGAEKQPFKGQSSKIPLPLEGTTAAGDSGSGVWVNRNQAYYLAGIASYRHFSMYGGQAGYANLSHDENVAWLRMVALQEESPFELVDKAK